MKLPVTFTLNLSVHTNQPVGVSFPPLDPGKKTISYQIKSYFPRFGLGVCNFFKFIELRPNTSRATMARSSIALHPTVR